MAKKKNLLFALFPNTHKRQSKNIAIGICEFLSQRGVQVTAEDDEAAVIGAIPLSTVDPASIDITVSLGGDGTILRLIHNHPEIEAPMVGINLGSLGFMADVPITEIYPTLEELINGHYSVQHRLMMEGRTPSKEHSFALNEVVIHRAQNAALIDLAIHVDGVYLNTFSADGIIIATPTGSTAYSLASGGPILTPTLDAFIITPICPHTISNRPIVLMPAREIQVQYLSEHDPVEVSYDGFIHFPLNTGEVLYLSAAKRRCQLVAFEHHDYFSTLRKKLGWTGKLRA